MKEDLKQATVSFSEPLDESWHYYPDNPPNFRPEELSAQDIEKCFDQEKDSGENSPSRLTRLQRRPQTPMQRPRSATTNITAEELAAMNLNGEDEDDDDNGDDADCDIIFDSCMSQLDE